MMAAHSAQAGSNVLSLMHYLRGVPDVDYLQFLIAYHAAPTLSGIKPSTLLCPHSRGRNLGRALIDVAPCLAHSFGVTVAQFRNKAGALLLFVYSPVLLRQVLSAGDVCAILRESGYGALDAIDIDGLLRILGQRCGGADFPHEIGVFLGYPAADVREFMRHGGRSCCATGCWKSYGDAGCVRRSSERFRRAKLRAAELIVSGKDLDAVVGGLRGDAGDVSVTAA